MKTQTVMCFSELLNALCDNGVIDSWGTSDQRRVYIHKSDKLDFADIRLYVETKDAVVNVERCEVERRSICRRINEVDIILVVTK